MKKRGIAIFFLYGFLLSATAGIGQANNIDIKNIGISFISNYAPRENNFGKQTWDICVGPEGLVYFANNGLLVSGDRSWKTHKFPGDAMRSVHAISKDTLLVGGANEIGLFIAGNIPGEFSYHSLIPQIDSSFENFGTVWDILASPHAIYLRSGSAIFEFKDNRVTPLMHAQLFEYMALLHDTLYFSIAGKGLGTYFDSTFHLLPFGGFFANKNIKGLFQLNASEKIIFSDAEGIFLVKDGQLKPFESDISKEIAEDLISDVLMIDNRYFIIGTVKNGIFIIDQQGKLLQHINKNVGLQNNTIISMELDDNNNLWLGLDNGISYIELNSCLTKINSETDIGTGYVTAFLDDKLFLGTNQGLFYTSWKKTDDGQIKTSAIVPVKNTSGQVWSLFESGGKLYCGHHKGLYRINGREAVVVNQNMGCWKVDSILNWPGYFIESTYRGFYILKAGENQILESVSKLSGLNHKTRIFQQDERGYFWIITSENKIIRFRIDGETFAAKDIEDMTNAPGLPDHERILMVGSNNQIFFSTESGIFNYNEQEKKFVRNEFYNYFLGDNKLCYEFFEDDFERIWFVTEDEIGYLSLNFGDTKKEYLNFSELSDFYTRIFGKIGVLDQDNILFGVDNGFYHFQTNCRESGISNFNSFINGVEYNAPPIAWEEQDNGTSSVPVFSHKKNSFSISFTSNQYIDQEEVQYKYFLEGLDDDWSDWTNRNIKEYNNLREGKYCFKVVSKNKFNTESAPASFDFVIKPPLLRSTGFIFLYGMLLAGLVLTFRLFWLRKISSERQKMEQLRITELEKKKKSFEKERLKSQRKIIELQNEKLEKDLLLKSKELSNSTYNILQKNRMLQNLKKEMEQMYLEKDLLKRDKNIKRLIRLIGNEINTNKDWEVFDMHFDAVHEDFIEKLREKYPDLTQNDQRFCVFIKMNNTTKEIATLMNLSVRGVETARYRLRKKMGLKRTENLFDVITSL